MKRLNISAVIAALMLLAACTPDAGSPVSTDPAAPARYETIIQADTAEAPATTQSDTLGRCGPGAIGSGGRECVPL